MPAEDKRPPSFDVAIDTEGRHHIAYAIQPGHYRNLISFGYVNEVIPNGVALEFLLTAFAKLC